MQFQGVRISFCKRKKKALAPSSFIARLVCKPSSVFDGHLSRTYISARLKRCGELCGPLFHVPDLASSGVYIAHCRQIAGELLPRLSILTEKIGGIFLLHCPWSRLHRELPGTHALWCSDFPQIFHATVRL